MLMIGVLSLVRPVFFTCKQLSSSGGAISPVNAVPGNPRCGLLRMCRLPDNELTSLETDDGNV